MIRDLVWLSQVHMPWPLKFAALGAAWGATSYVRAAMASVVGR